MSPSAPIGHELTQAYERFLTAVAELVPPTEMPGLAHMHHQFAQLQKQLGAPPDGRYAQAPNVPPAYKSAEMKSPIWEQHDQLVEGVSKLAQHSRVIGRLPQALAITRTCDSANQFGVSVQQALGKHYQKILTDPRTQELFATVRKLAGQHMAGNVRYVLGQISQRTTADHRDARRDLQSVSRRLDVGLLADKDLGSDHFVLVRRAQAALLVTSTAPAVTTSHGQPPRGATLQRDNALQRTPTRRS
ncbi:hypothetical protein AB0J43_02505 [Nonomuraea fuscirosea]